MSEQHIVAVVVTGVVGFVLALGLVAAIVNRPATPEHDLRRRILGIVSGIGGVPIGAAMLGSSLVAIVVVVAWAVVMVAAFYLVLRPPPDVARARNQWSADRRWRAK